MSSKMDMEHEKPEVVDEHQPVRLRVYLLLSLSLCLCLRDDVG